MAADDAALVQVLDHLIAIPLSHGIEMSALTLNVSNLVVDASAASANWPAGQYVALTIVAPGGWGRDDTWWPGKGSLEPPMNTVAPLASAAGARYAYGRNIAGRSSVTVLFARGEWPAALSLRGWPGSAAAGGARSPARTRRRSGSTPARSTAGR